jgi:hypothetical protein
MFDAYGVPIELMPTVKDWGFHMSAFPKKAVVTARKRSDNARHPHDFVEVHYGGQNAGDIWRGWLPGPV